MLNEDCDKEAGDNFQDVINDSHSPLAKQELNRQHLTTTFNNPTLPPNQQSPLNRKPFLENGRNK